MAESKFENAESSALSASPSTLVEGNGLGAASLQEIQSIDSQSSADNSSLPKLDFDYGSAKDSGDVWAPEESLALNVPSVEDMRTSTVNSPGLNREAINGSESNEDVWAPEESLKLDFRPIPAETLEPSGVSK